MLFAALGDIHGNLPALHAILDEIDERGIMTAVNTGDAVGGFPHPNEVIEELIGRRIHSVQGDWDRLVSRPLKVNPVELTQPPHEGMPVDAVWTRRHLRSANIEWLHGLPRRRIVTIDGLSVSICHGAPSGASHGLTPDTDEQRFLRERELANVHIIVCGRTHVPFARHVADTLFVNPGSVGVPTDDESAARYAIVSTETSPWSVEFRSLPYEYKPG